MTVDPPDLIDPWLVAVWPGMGNVAASAGYYLMSQLGMHAFAEVQARDLFDVDHVEVKEGVLRVGRLPRSRFFVWKDPAEQRDIVVFIGEAQPPTGKYAFCDRVIDFAEQIGVSRVFTFAAMGTDMHPEQDARTFGVATDEEGLEELRGLELEIIQDGQITGLNGLLLGVAAERGLRGTCLLGEMPHVFSGLPFPKGSLAVLEAFMTIAGIEVDTGELVEQSLMMEQQLGELLGQVEHMMHRREEPSEATETEVAEEPAIDPETEQRLESLFEQAASDRTRAYELKRELDRLALFEQYEDRFLDLFSKPGGDEE